MSKSKRVSIVDSVPSMAAATPPPPTAPAPSTADTPPRKRKGETAPPPLPTIADAIESEKLEPATYKLPPSVIRWVHDTAAATRFLDKSKRVNQSQLVAAAVRAFMQTYTPPK